VPFHKNSPLKRSEWHVLTRDHAVLPATHTFIHEWNEPPCLYSPAAAHHRTLTGTHFPSHTPFVRLFVCFFVCRITLKSYAWIFVKFCEQVVCGTEKTRLNFGSHVKHILDTVSLPSCDCLASRRTEPLCTSAAVLVQRSVFITSQAAYRHRKLCRHCVNFSVA